MRIRLFIFAFFLFVSSENIELLDNVLRSMRKGLDFFRLELKNLNLDSVIGTRIVEGQLHQALISHRKIPNRIRLEISNLIEKAALISNLSIPYIQLNQPEYYNTLQGSIQPGIWELNEDLQRTYQVTDHFISPREQMKESQSDECVANVLGTNDNPKRKCIINKFCLDLMTIDGFSKYSLSHQLFFWQLTKKAGCLKDNSLKHIKELNKRICSNMLVEAEYFSKQSSPRYHDLFMEQIALCGMEGFREDFCKEEWTLKIINWQYDDGCWGLTENSKRIKREEKVLKNGCLAHRTAVALSSQTQLLRHLLEKSDN
ncbi:DgyrCDS7116 [Dimorphilus gyrociliatus]|uniref:DgyrCDS7116 n=1 Tax=Dimorphilus gyrociliatus TaxID=2664684 RepID=A0A7I8VQ21_9ANNE|nr:DgyrCDS7116 [Dimorphilus gyrociliatus]